MGDAGFAAPLVIGATVLGADGGTAAGERIGMAALGMGGRGSGVFRSLTADPDVQAIAACDVQPDRLEQAKNAGLAVYTDFRELLARDDVDAVVIATPDHW